MVVAQAIIFGLLIVAASVAARVIAAADRHLEIPSSLSFQKGSRIEPRSRIFSFWVDLVRHSQPIGAFVGYKEETVAEREHLPDWSLVIRVVDRECSAAIAWVHGRSLRDSMFFASAAVRCQLSMSFLDHCYRDSAAAPLRPYA
jgi:hypothetical protein